MAIIANLSQIATAADAGQTRFSSWRKAPTQTTGAGIWFDLSMSPGNPVPNYYAASPSIGVPLALSTDGGFYHGPATNGLYTKYLTEFTIMTSTAAAAPLGYYLCDFLYFYPFMDMSNNGVLQTVDNTAAVPRYPLGGGVQMVAVEVAGQSGVGNPRFTVQYTNQSGVTGQTTPICTCNTQTVNGTLINSCATIPQGAAQGRFFAGGPFLPLAPGDTGVRKIEGVTFLDADIGLVTFVLVKPLDNGCLRETTAPFERAPVMDAMRFPVVMDDAYLSLLVCPFGSLSGAQLMGTLTTTWV